MKILVRMDGILFGKERIFSTTHFNSRWPCGRMRGSGTAPSLRLQVLILPLESIFLSPFCVSYIFLRFTCRQSTRGVLKDVANLSVVVKIRKGGDPTPLSNVAPCEKSKNKLNVSNL